MEYNTETKRFSFYTTEKSSIPTSQHTKVLISSVISPSVFFCQIYNSKSCAFRHSVGLVKNNIYTFFY